MSESYVEVQEGIRKWIRNIQTVIYTDEKKLEFLLASKLAGGHVLLADSHGVGKTSLAGALAGSLEWDISPRTETPLKPFNRVQCTVDLLPQDILGYNHLTYGSSENRFIPGPVFSHFLLCDEINLLTPKTQGSFFQVMEEQKVTIEGKTYPLESPFFIIATKNLEGNHLFPLPAPQLDRFMIRLSLGFPSESDECKIVKQHGRLDGWKDFRSVIKASELIRWQTLVDNVYLDDNLISYIVRCVRETRKRPEIQTPASPRSALKTARLVKALALIRGQAYVTSEMIQEALPLVLSHRILLRTDEDDSRKILQEITESVPLEEPLSLS